VLVAFIFDTKAGDIELTLSSYGSTELNLYSPTASYSSACLARSVSAARLHSRPSRSRMMGLVVTPENIPHAYSGTS
jgi:hypothetical protein